MLKLLASRSVYDEMLSRYKKFGQFTYNDTRDTEDDVVIRYGVREDKRKWVTVTATIKENVNSKNEQNVLFYKYYKQWNNITYSD